MNRLCWMLLPLLGSAMVWAQDSAPNVPTPQPPLVARAPDFARWTVEVKRKSAAAPSPSPTSAEARFALPPPKVLSRIEVTKTGDVMREVRSYEDGTKSENWLAGGKYLHQDPQAGYVVMMDLNSDPDAPAFGTTDFEGMAWLDLKYYLGAAEAAGQPCFVYSWKDKMPSADEIIAFNDPMKMRAVVDRFRHKPVVPTTAWISQETRLPVKVDDENATYTFKFQQPPTTPLTLSGPFAKLWKEYLAGIEEQKSHLMPVQR